MSIKSQIHRLADLQALEIDILNIKELLEKIPEELEVLERQRSEFEKKIENAETVIETLQKEYRAGESDSLSIVAGIEKEEEKLRAVKNNKEYQAMLAGIEHLKADQTAIEDRMLESLEKIEMAEAELASKREEFKRFDARLVRNCEVIRQKADQAQKELDQKEEARSQLENSIEVKYLERFRQVQAAKGGGLAIAPVHNAVCKGCHMNIPPQLNNDLQRFDQLSICPKCQRIIYWETDPMSDEAAVEAQKK